jgi:hypothetical protein
VKVVEEGRSVVDHVELELFRVVAQVSIWCLPLVQMEERENISC